MQNYNLKNANRLIKILSCMVFLTGQTYATEQLNIYVCDQALLEKKSDDFNAFLELKMVSPELVSETKYQKAAAAYVK
jgi:ABC-type iron transport system FetAB ATPase subunit